MLDNRDIVNELDCSKKTLRRTLVLEHCVFLDWPSGRSAQTLLVESFVLRELCNVHHAGDDM